LEEAHFVGYPYNLITSKSTRVGPLNPEWVRHFFKGVCANLVMLKPKHWWPMVIGHARKVHDDVPNKLLIKEIKIQYEQFDREQCLIMGVASSLHYCGLLKEATKGISLLARKFKFLIQHVALNQLRKYMQQLVSCLGKCEIFNVRSAKKRTIKNLSIQELLRNRTRFPTVVLLHGIDGANNHSFVVVHDLIFDSTQSHALKLCRQSVNCIWGEGGMASINVALRLKTGHSTKEKLSHQERRSW
jgi:hypothetical protein